MEIRSSEKLILVMLSEIYKKLEIDGEVNPDFIQSAIFSGNLWGLDWEYESLSDAQDKTPPKVKEVIDFLDMWDFVESSYENLSTEGAIKSVPQLHK